jgi:hypothetical protein
LQADAQILAKYREVGDRLIARPNAVDDYSEIDITTLEKVRETWALLESELDGITSGDRAIGRRLKFAMTLVAVPRFDWLLLYSVTIHGMHRGSVTALGSSPKGSCPSAAGSGKFVDATASSNVAWCKLPSCLAAFLG